MLFWDLVKANYYVLVKLLCFLFTLWQCVAPTMYFYHNTLHFGFHELKSINLWYRMNCFSAIWLYFIQNMQNKNYWQDWNLLVGSSWYHVAFPAFFCALLYFFFCICLLFPFQSQLSQMRVDTQSNWDAFSCWDANQWACIVTGPSFSRQNICSRLKLHIYNS